ncbi:MAG: hypothetical protein GWP08_04285 [Nitrospiraceae bacterium]|nr:hypothetical protein [Nitrospiraceae bacterium]
MLLQAVNALLLVRAVIRRTPPPWKTLRWLFTVAALALIICMLPVVVGTLFRGDILGFLIYGTLFAMPPLCQIAIL